MALKFYYNDTTYSLADYTASDSRVSTFDSQAPAIFHYYQNTGSSSTAEHKIPASSTRGTSVQFAEDDNYYYKMDNSSPTLCFRKNDTNYYCAKSITSEAKVTYDIPAGTYTPSAFKALIEKYISVNGSRQASNAYKVTVNNQTYSGFRNDYIFYASTGTSSGTPVTYGVSFGSDPNFNSTAAATSDGFTNYRTYIVSANGSILPFFNEYANYNITVTTGINFS